MIGRESDQSEAELLPWIFLRCKVKSAVEHGPKRDGVGVSSRCSPFLLPNFKLIENLFRFSQRTPLIRRNRQGGWNRLTFDPPAYSHWPSSVDWAPFGLESARPHG